MLIFSLNVDDAHLILFLISGSLVLVMRRGSGGPRINITVVARSKAGPWGERSVGTQHIFFKIP